MTEFGTGSAKRQRLVCKKEPSFSCHGASHSATNHKLIIHGLQHDGIISFHDVLSNMRQSAMGIVTMIGCTLGRRSDGGSVQCEKQCSAWC